MINGYANAYYDPFAGVVKLFTWDDNGRRTVETHAYRPFLYIEDKDGKAKSIFGTTLTKKEFRNTFDRKKYVETCGLNRIFYNIPPYQQFLIEKFGTTNEDKDFGRHALKIHFLDIEVLSKDEFPDPKEAKYPINLLTVWDTDKQEMVTFGERPIKRKMNTRYIHISNEADLLKAYVNYVVEDYPHVLSGWNSSGFDIPYILNRITRVLGEEWTRKLSPVNKIRDSVVFNEAGTPKDIKVIEAMHNIDYLDVYKKFAPEKRESYRLDYIGEIELGKNKIDYGDRTLWELAEQDWDLFVEYNIVDVELLVDLDRKLKYMNLLRMVATVGLTTLDNGLSSINFITGALAIFAKKKNVIIPTFTERPEPRVYEGGYVGVPTRGIREHIVSFDANSLYPNTMITLNSSLETKIGVIIDKSPEKITIRHVNGKIFELEPKKFLTFIKAEQVSISKSNVLFSQKKKGIMPDMVETYYNSRVSVKGEMKTVEKKLKDLEKKGEDVTEIANELERLDVKQGAIKIIINSVYGACANRFFCMADMDIAESITATGREMIKESGSIIDKHLHEKYNIPSNVSTIQYQDTDSCYISLDYIVKNVHKDKPFVTDGKVDAFWLNICDEIGTSLNELIGKWATKALNSVDPRFEFKREAICDSTLFLAKKKYVLHMLNKDGKHYDGWKFVGVEVKQAILPKVVRNMLEKTMKTLVMTKDMQKTNDVVREIYEKYPSMDLFDISNIRATKNLDKYYKMCKGLTFGKGTPIQVKAAMIYNHLLDELGIAGKYEKIGNGDKVRYFYCQTPNKYGINVVGYKYIWPTEFDDIIRIDYNKVRLKQIFEPINRCYEANGWRLFEPGKELSVDLFSMLLDEEVTHQTKLDEEDDDNLEYNEKD